MLKGETEEKSAVLREIVERYAGRPGKMGREEAGLLVRVVNRALEII
jgi:hypothetical protein